MAKMYGQKRTSKACRNYVRSVWLTDYELGHDLFRGRRELPLTASKHMLEGYRKAAIEAIEAMNGQIRLAYRRGKLSILPRYSAMVAGIEVHDYTYETRARRPLKYGARKHPRYLAAKIDCMEVERRQEGIRGWYES